VEKLIIKKNKPQQENALQFIREYKINLPFLPDDIVVSACNFEISEYHNKLFEKFNICCPDPISNAVNKRQAEYLAGRFIAISAIRNLGVQINNIPIGKHRAPIWPREVKASITHTNSQAICIAGYQHNYQYIGVDLENLLSSKVVSEIKANIINDNEEALLKDNKLNFETAFTIIFSAKESLFKALYASVGDYFDFLDAEITEICNDKNSFSIILLKNLTPELIIETKFVGYFIIENGSILTALIE